MAKGLVSVSRFRFQVWSLSALSHCAALLAMLQRDSRSSPRGGKGITDEAEKHAGPADGAKGKARFAGARFETLTTAALSADVEVEARTRAIIEVGGCGINLRSDACRSASPYRRSGWPRAR